MTKLRITAAALAVTGILSGCGGASDEVPSVKGRADRKTVTASVAVANIAFSPSTLEIARGVTVTWASGDDGVRHTVTSGTPAKPGIPGTTEGKDARPDGIFRGELEDSGATFSFTFTDAGEYRYFCEIHPAMVARIIVT